MGCTEEPGGEVRQAGVQAVRRRGLRDSGVACVPDTRNYRDKEALLCISVGRT